MYLNKEFFIKNWISVFKLKKSVYKKYKTINSLMVAHNYN